MAWHGAKFLLVLTGVLTDGLRHYHLQIKQILEAFFYLNLDQQ